MLTSGDRLGHYQIVAPLGVGGMGEVYRARDERLGRDVAIKVLPEFVRRDRNVVARFEREARAVAALSHRNVISIHHLDASGDVPYFAMELLEGETLAERIARGLSQREAIEIGSQIADALAAAHDRGIVHRDLKPQNVFVLRDGTVKVLDFGLARLAEPEAIEESTAVRTAEGAVMGTHGYMSPEQLSGQPLDHRSDIFSLGCVLHEMLTGVSPFRRQTAAASLAAVLHEEPGALPAGTSPDLERVVSRSLRKDREQRFQSARDIAIELRDAGAPSTSSATPRRRVAMAPAAGAAVVVAIAAVMVFSADRDQPAATPAARIASLAVLPFESAGTSSDTDFVADGVTEGLINTLARLPETKVVARTTAFTYKGKPLDLKLLARDLDIEAVLTGKVTFQQGLYRVQADLIEVRSGAQLWGERYDAVEVTGIEQKIAADVGPRLRGDLSAAQLARLRATGTKDDEAYLLYLKGRREWHRRENTTVTAARDFFQQAIDRDPNYADAYAGLADTFALFGGIFRPVGGKTLSRDEALALGEAAALRALAIDPGHAAAYASLGLIEANRYHFRAAERHLRRSLELNPNYSQARSWYWLILQAEGRMDEAMRQIRAIQSVDPLWIRGNVGLAYYIAGDLEEAERESHRNLIQDDTFWTVHWVLGMVAERRGQLEEARQRYAKGLGRGPAFEALIARIDVKTGNPEKARKKARDLEEKWKRGEQLPTPIAYIYSALGEHDTAFLWLDRALESRDVLLRNQMNTIGVSELRDDPRFAALKKRMFEIEAADEARK